MRGKHVSLIRRTLNYRGYQGDSGKRKSNDKKQKVGKLFEAREIYSNTARRGPDRGAAAAHIASPRPELRAEAEAGLRVLRHEGVSLGNTADILRCSKENGKIGQ